jgi:adenosylhomocysteine nucleosidase
MQHLIKAPADLLIVVALPGKLTKENIPQHRLIYTGVGKVNATLGLCKAIAEHRPRLVVNYGTAGSLRPNLSGLHRVSRFMQRTTPYDRIAAIEFDDQGLSCGTGDSFVDQLPEIATDLVDMEAYALAKVCLLEKIPFECFKHISDNANSDASSVWQEHVHRGTSAFIEKLQELLRHYGQ